MDFPSKVDLEDVFAHVASDAPTILDIGSNDGLEVKDFFRLRPQAKVVCFEPDGRAFERLQAR